MPRVATDVHGGINRAPSPVIARALPWLVVMLGSVLQTLPVIASAPIMPPLGFLFLLAWRQLHPNLMPVWAGLPLGLIDDLYSGQPMGSAMLLWSVAMIAVDLFEARFPWRSYVLEWLVAAGFILGYLFLSYLLARAAGGAAEGGVPLLALVPQLLLSVLVFPLVELFIGWCDRIRLWRFRVVA